MDKTNDNKLISSEWVFNCGALDYIKLFEYDNYTLPKKTLLN